MKKKYMLGMGAITTLTIVPSMVMTLVGSSVKDVQQGFINGYSSSYSNATNIASIKGSNITNGIGGVMFQSKNGDIYSMGNGSKLQVKKSGVDYFLNKQSNVETPIITNKIIEATNEVEFKIQGFDATTMDIKKISSSGTLTAYDSVTKTVKISGLTNEDFAEIAIATKINTGTSIHGVFSDGTITQIHKATFLIEGIKPIITSTTKNPSTATSNDGEVSFTIKGLNLKTMDIKSVGSGWMTIKDNVVTLSGLSNGENAQVAVLLKNPETWADGTTDPVYSASIAVKYIPKETGLTKGQKAGIGIGVIFGITALFAGIWLMFKRGLIFKRRKK